MPKAPTWRESAPPANEWREVSETIRRWSRSPKLPPSDPRAIDALRGSLWEDRWRGTLGEYLAQYGGELLASRTASRLEACPVVSWPKIKQPAIWGWLPSMGLGTYRWKYDGEIIARAVELGAALIDTAEGYGFGKVETALGQVLKAKRLPVAIATKVARNHMTFPNVLCAAERSLKKLNRDVIDLYQIHWPNREVPIDQTMRAAAKLLEEGKIRHLGVCNFSADLIEQAQAALPSPHRIVSNQIRFNVLDQEHEALRSYCSERHITLIGYSPLCQDYSLLKAKRIQPYEAIQFVLRSGVSPIPQSNNRQHLDELFSGKAITDARFFELRNMR